MLADTVEAKARAEKPSDSDQISELVKSVFNLYSTGGQMDNTPLSFRDLSTARDSFVRVLKNIYHPRVLYPAQLQEQQEDKDDNGPKAGRRQRNRKTIVS